MRALHVAAAVILCSAFRPAPAQEKSRQPPRLANGAVIEGEIQEATSEGLAIKSVQKGVQVIPWKYLSVGTRYRYSEMPAMKELLLQSP